AAGLARAVCLPAAWSLDMSDAVLEQMRDLIQEDVNHRGLRTDPVDNLLTACQDDFAAAGRSLAETRNASVGIVTGFFIPTADPPGGETDGPLGAIFLARALLPLGIRVVLCTDFFCKQALEAGLSACGLSRDVPLWTIPSAKSFWNDLSRIDWKSFSRFGMEL